jgi:hypothetical protein
MRNESRLPSANEKDRGSRKYTHSAEDKPVNLAAMPVEWQQAKAISVQARKIYSRLKSISFTIG